MYKGLTAKTPGCVAFSLPVQRRNSLNPEVSSVFPILHRPAQRAADTEGGFEPERRRSQVTILFQGRLQTRHNWLSGSDWVRYAMAGGRFGAASGLQR